MVLKTWSLAFVLFMIMLFLGVVDSIDVISPPDSMENAMSTTPIFYDNDEGSSDVSLDPTAPSYKAAKEAFLAEHPFFTEYDAFNAPNTLQDLAKAMQGDPIAQAKLAATWGFKVGSYIEYIFIAEEVFGPSTAQELLQDAKHIAVTGAAGNYGPKIEDVSPEISEIKVSESGKIQVSPTIGDLMSEIPEGNRPIIGINEDGTLDLPNDHFIIPPEAQTDNAFKIYVIGDSIAWGNGLNREDKYYYLVAKELQENLGEPVEVIVYAHSGAPISGEDENSIINQAKKIPNDVDLILVSGGINDVGIEHILDSSIEASSVTSLSAPIEERMENLLRELINKNQHVKIVVTGYYNIISRDSKLETVDNYLGQYWTSDISKKFEAPDINRLIANSIAFNSACTTALRSAVKKVDGKEGRIVFVSPEFQDSNSYKASDTYLWGLISLVPQRSNADNHNIDAIAHPNRNGASKYADAINNITGAKGFAWLQKTTQNTTKERIWKDFPGVSRNYPWIDSVTSTDLNEDEDVSDETNIDTPSSDLPAAEIIGPVGPSLPEWGENWDQDPKDEGLYHAYNPDTDSIWLYDPNTGESWEAGEDWYTGGSGYADKPSSDSGEGSDTGTDTGDGSDTGTDTGDGSGSGSDGGATV